MQKSPEDGVTAPLHLTRTNSEPLHTHALHGTWTLTVAERVGELLNCSTAFPPSISFTPSTPYSPPPPPSCQARVTSGCPTGTPAPPPGRSPFTASSAGGASWGQSSARRGRHGPRQRGGRRGSRGEARTAVAAARSCGSDCVGSKRVSGTKHSSTLQLCVLLRTPSSVLHRGWSRSSPASWVQFHSVR